MSRRGRRYARKGSSNTALIVAIVLVITGIGVAFAAFSQNLTISGTATVQTSSWKVFFTNSSSGNDPGSTGVSLTPTLSNTNNLTITAANVSNTLKTASFTWEGTLKTPGDKIMYTIYIRNTGSYTAKLTSINVPNLTCTKGSSNETTVCGKINYGVFTDTAGSTRLATGDTITAGSYKTVYVIAEFNKNTAASDLPNANVTVNPSTITMTYTQQ